MADSLTLAEIRADLHEARQRVADLEQLERLAVKVYGDSNARPIAPVMEFETAGPVSVDSPGPLAGAATKDAILSVLTSSMNSSFKVDSLVETMQSLGWRGESDDPRPQVRQALIRLMEADPDHVYRPGYGLWGYRDQVPAPEGAEQRETEQGGR
jgi:hypothetical protein